MVHIFANNFVQLKWRKSEKDYAIVIRFTCISTKYWICFPHFCTIHKIQTAHIAYKITYCCPRFWYATVFFTSPLSGLQVTETMLFICGSVCVSRFVRATLCTTLKVQDYVVHHRPALCTMVQKGDPCPREVGVTPIISRALL